MKRLNVKLVALLMCIMPMLIWGADTSKLDKTPAESIEQQQSFVTETYNALMNFTQQTTAQLISKSYGAISRLFNTVVASLLGCIAFFWLWKQLKNGSIGKEEAFKALNFTILFVIVYVLLNSSKAFNEFTNLFLIPQKIVSSALSANTGGSVAQQLNDAFIKPFIILSQIPGVVIDYYTNQPAWYEFFDTLGALIMGIASAGTTSLIYLVYILFNLIVVIAVILIHMYATFLSGIYMIFLPIMIPLLLIPQTKSIFFAWIKSFIGITMYIPLSMIGINIINNTSELIAKQGDYNTINVVMNIGFYTLIGIISCLIALLLLYKIPTWINELLGVANQGVGAGGAMGMLKTAGMGLAGYAKGAISNITSAKSGKTAVARGIGNVLTGGMGGALSQAKTGAKSFIKNGFKARGEYTGKK